MIRTVLAALVGTLRDGFRIWWLAPVIPLLVVVPEAIQHVVEISIGMFDSREAARALGDDPRRMAAGALKVVGLVLAILATIRFWSSRDLGGRETGGRWWDPRAIAWRNFFIALGLIILSSLPGLLLRPTLGEEASAWIDLGVLLATLPLLVLLASGLSGDRSDSLGRVYRHGWLSALAIVVLAAIVWIPLQYLHGLNHQWAMGAPALAQWALMAFDSLVVGLLATMTGTAIHRGRVAGGGRPGRLS